MQKGSNKIYLLLLLCGFGLSLSAQRDWTYACQVNVGCNINLYSPLAFSKKNKKQSFPGLKVFAGISVNCVYQRQFLVNYSASLGLYTRSLGNNLNPLVNDVQLDLTNTFICGAAWGDSTRYVKYYRTLNNVPFNNMFTQMANEAYLGSILIFNNHKRNQAIGCIGFNTGQFSLNYSNDGPPFGFFATGDSFDRWWTGHGCIYYHSTRNFNYLEFGFDQFTGYSPLLYELSGLLGINIPDYNIDYKNDSLKLKSTHRPEYNSSTYNLRVNFDPNFGGEIGVIGSLKSKNDRYFAAQDIIHISRRFSLHPNQDVNRLFVGGTYRYTSDVR